VDFKSIVVALILLALLFGWYAWLEAGERRRRSVEETRSPFDGTGDARRAGRGGEKFAPGRTEGRAVEVRGGEAQEYIPR
jgi:hypothetical protein